MGRVDIKELLERLEQLYLSAGAYARIGPANPQPIDYPFLSGRAVLVLALMVVLVTLGVFFRYVLSWSLASYDGFRPTSSSG